jgi:hypothetical protein
MFEHDIKAIINMYSEENESNTPDYVLAQFLLGCLESFNRAVNEREKHNTLASRDLVA